MSATIYKTTGEAMPVSPDNGRDFSLKELQAIVGGYIEVVPLPENRLLILNEDGYSMGLPSNDLATIRFPHVHTGPRGIVGDVLECHRSQIK